MEGHDADARKSTMHMIGPRLGASSTTNGSMTEREKLQRGTQRQDAVRRRFWGTTLPSIRLVNG